MTHILAGASGCKMKIFVFGGSGMLGSVLAHVLVQANHDITISTRNKIPRWLPVSKKVGIVKFDVSQNLPDLSEYDYVINCIGAIKQKKYSNTEYYQLNSVFPWKLTGICHYQGPRVIHVSSDCVFSGLSKDPYMASASMDAVDDYGMSKALGEPYGAIVIRTSIIGPAEESFGLFEWLRKNSSNSIPGYTNHTWSGVTTLFLAQFIEGLISKPEIEIPPAGGLFQLASQPVTKDVLLELINEIFDLKKTIRPEKSIESINRTLLPSVRHAPDIHAQLVELRDWMKKCGYL